MKARGQRGAGNLEKLGQTGAFVRRQPPRDLHILLSVSDAELLDAYPRLTKADIQAAFAYAADTLWHEKTVLQPAS